MGAGAGLVVCTGMRRVKNDWVRQYCIDLSGCVMREASIVNQAYESAMYDATELAGC